jgi:folate-dependent phosphoribosylglycinamide formyltransferase PurN
VPVLPGDTEESLHERIKVAERVLYPATVAWALTELEAGREIVAPAQVPAGAASAERSRREKEHTRR